MNGSVETIDFAEVDRRATLTLELELEGDWSDWDFASMIRTERRIDATLLATFAFDDPIVISPGDPDERTLVVGTVAASVMSAIDLSVERAHFDVKATRAPDEVAFVYRCTLKLQDNTTT